MLSQTDIKHIDKRWLSTCIHNLAEHFIMKWKPRTNLKCHDGLLILDWVFFQFIP